MTPVILTPPVARPVTAAEVGAFSGEFTLEGDGDQTALVEALIDAVTDHAERLVLRRAIMPQRRRVFMDALDDVVNLEPYRVQTAGGSSSPPMVKALNEAGVATVVPASSYYTAPAIGLIALRSGASWPRPERAESSFCIDYWAGWDVAPGAVKLMIQRAVVAQSSNRGAFAPKDSAVLIPPAIASIGKAYALGRFGL